MNRRPTGLIASKAITAFQPNKTAEGWASMAEVADLVVFLASDRGRYINGTQIPIDGGYSVNAR